MFVRILLLAIFSFMEVSAGTPPFDDDVNLARELMEDFTSDECRTLNAAKAFKKCFDIPDDQLWRALMIVWQEAKARRLQGSSGSRDEIDGRRMLSGAMLWFPLLADARAKQWLLDVAAAHDEDSFLRTTALASFLRIADAEETVDVLLRFLVESERMDSQARSTLLWSAFETFGDSSPTKREAIVDSLCVALANEDNKWLFRVYDDILCQISDQYANSTQRRDILLKLIKAPALCKADEIALPELEKKRRTLKKNRLSTTINTNLTTLKERNYTQPAVPSGYALSLGTAAHEETANVKLKKMLIPGGWRLTLLFFCGTLALSITILGLFIQKKRRVKATLKRWHEAK